MDYKLGLVAKDIQNSVTPTVYSAFAADLGLEISFDIMNIPEDKLSDTLEYARQNLNGFNITMPYKQAALAYMDELDETAVQCGSTNTVLVQSGRLIAYNTDGWGLIRALKQRGVEVENADVVMLGAGGVGYSIAYNLMVNRVRSVKVVNIFLDQAEALCQKFGPVFTPHPLTYENLASCCENADLFINASVMGQIGYDEFTSFDFLKELNLDAVFVLMLLKSQLKLVPLLVAWVFRLITAKSMTAVRASMPWRSGPAKPQMKAIALVESFN